ncbi:MAG: hypothetical protein R2848_18685 [Thermomicrobiales bacterium]
MQRLGLLHDMLEDSDVTLSELRAVGVTDAELAAIQAPYPRRGVV